MTKKEYIIKLMTALEGKRAFAKGLKLLVEGNILDDVTIDGLVKIFVAAIHEVKNAESKNILEKGKDYLQKLKKVEREQHAKEGEELKDLDNIIASF
jgi:hypothetical protein